MVSATRRNASVLAGSAAVLGLVMLFPTSTNRGPDQRPPGQALAPAGIITQPTPTILDPVATAGTSPAPKTTATLSQKRAPGRTAAPHDRSPATSAVTVNGTPVQTVYGYVQVQIVVSGSRIVSATAIDYPQRSGRDREINAYAIPALQDETVAAQSAAVDTITGATFTSEGYQQSLQAALDAALLRAGGLASRQG